MGQLRNSLKTILGRLLFHTRLYRRLMHDRAVVVAFHRVDDRYEGDPITITESEFVRYCDFFGRYFTVVGLRELLDRKAAGEDISRLLAITFDDGYRDNFAFAAPELARRGMPATFFVATGFIEAERSSWWDEERGIESEWMTWEEVRGLEELGMDVAPHTVDHPDIATIPPDETVAEIERCIETLRRETTAPALEFAYPFGGPEHINEEARDAVRRSGVSCCLSCFGGTVAGGDDPHRLMRTPINDWYASPYHFGFEVATDLVRRRRAAS